MSENTRLDIDSNIPQQMDKIGKAADDAAKKINKVGSNTALAELERTMKLVNNDFKKLGKTVDDSFGKALENLKKSDMPDSIKDIYNKALISTRSGTKAFEKDFKAAARAYENATNDIIAAKAKLDKVKSERKPTRADSAELNSALKAQKAAETAMERARVQSKSLELFHLNLRNALNREYNDFYLKRQATQKTASLVELQAFKDLGIKLQGEDLALYKRLLQNRKDFNAAVKAEVGRTSPSGVYSEIKTGKLKVPDTFFGPPASLFQKAAQEKEAQILAIQKTALQRQVMKATVEAEGAYTSLRSMKVFDPKPYRNIFGPPASLFQKAAQEKEAQILAIQKTALQRQVMKATVEAEGAYTSLRSMKVFDPQSKLTKASEATADLAKKDQEFLNRYKNATQDLVSLNSTRAKSLLDYMSVVRAVYDKSPDFATKKFGRSAVGSATGSDFDVLKSKLEGTNKQIPSLLQGLKALGGRLIDVHSATRGLASGFNMLWLTWGQLGPLFAGAAISMGTKNIVSLGAEVGHQLETIRVLSQESDSAMQALNATLLETAKSGPHGPLEVAKAMKALSLAGLDASQVQSALPRVMQFAIAGTTTIDKAAEVITGVATAFGYTAENFDIVGDAITKTAAASKAGVEDMGEAFKAASVVSSQFGVSIKDVSLLLALQANLNIKNSAAGTNVRNMYTDLSGRSKQARKILKEFNLELTDSEGKFKDVVSIAKELDAVFSKLDAKSARALKLQLASERGGKPITAMYEAYKTEARDFAVVNGEVVETVTNQLEQLKKKVEDNSGFMVISAAKLNMTPLSQMQSVVATLQTSFVTAFSGMEDTVIVFSAKLKELFNSEEFSNTLKNLITGVASFTATLLENLDTLGSVILGYAGFKVLATTASLFIGLDTWVKSTTASLVAYRTAQAAAAGADTAAAAAAGSAAAATARVGGNLVKAIPVIGTIISVGAAAWSMWELYNITQSKTAEVSKTAADGLRKSGIISALEEETKALDKQNEILAMSIALKRRVSEAEFNARNLAEENATAQAKQLKDSEAQVRASVKKEADIRQAAANLSATLSKTIGSKSMDSPAVKSLLDQADKEADARKKINSVKAKDEIDAALEARQLAAKLRDERDAELRKYELKPTGTQTFDPDAKNNANKSARAEASAIARQISAIEKAGASRVSALKSGYDLEVAVLEKSNALKLISDGVYQYQLMALTEKSEAERLAEIAKTDEDVEALYAKELSKYKAGTEEYKAVEDKHTAYLESSTSSRVAIESEASKRRLLAEKDFQGALLKIRKDATEYLDDLKGERAKEAALTALERKYESVTDASSTWLQAEKAAAFASVNAAAKHESKLRDMEKAYEDVKKSADDLRDSALEALMSGNPTAGAYAEWEKLDEKRRVQEQALATFRKGIDKDVADQGAIAYEEAFRKRSADFKNTLADALSTALIEGSKDGSKSLRKLLENELKSPFTVLFRMSIDAFMGAFGTLGGAGDAGGSIGSSSLSNAISGLSAVSTMKTAYEALSGAIEGSIGKSFENFAKSDIGGKFGLSSANVKSTTSLEDLGFSVKPGETAQLSEAVDIAKTSLTDLGKTFKDVGIGMASAFAGQALRKGISGGYSVGGAGETLMDAASIAAGFVPVIGPVLQIITGAVSGLVNRAFGMKLKDTGIQGSFGSQGFSGSQYQDLKGGWFRSDKTNLSNLDQGTSNTFTNTFRSIQASTAVLATNMGLSAQAALDFKKDIKVSLQGLDSKAQGEALNKMFTDMQEEMAKAVLDAWGDWSIVAKYGETASEVLTKVSNNLTGFNGILDLLGVKLIDLSLTGAATASSIIEAAGGLDNITGAYSSYYGTFYSESERNKKSIETLTEKFAALGVIIPSLTTDAEGFVTNGGKARDSFREMVTAAANLGNIELATELIKLSSDFAQVTKSAETTSESLKGLQQNTKQLEAELLKAQGNFEGYSAAIRAIDTINMTAVESATYDYNKVIESQIELLGKADEARSTAASAEIRLLEAQGKASAALTLQRTIDIKGMSEAQAAAYDYAAAIDSQISRLEKLSTARDSIASSDIKLLEAQGQATRATSLQRELDIKGLSRAEIAAYDYSKAIDSQVTKLTEAADIVSKLGTVSSDLASYLKQFSKDQSNIFASIVRDALSGNLDAMGQVTSEADKAIESARAKSRSTSEYLLKRAEIISKVAEVKKFADTLKSETDAEKIVAAIKGSTATSDEVKSLGTRLSSQDLAVSLNATLSSVIKTAGASADIKSIQTLFSSMAATVTAMGMTDEASTSGQQILTMFDAMRATVLAMTLSAPKSQIDAIANTFNNIVGTVTALNTVPGVLPGTVSAITDSLSYFQALISSIAINAPDSNLKDILIGNSDVYAYSMAIAAAMENGSGTFGLTAEQSKEFLNANTTIKKLLEVSGGTVSLNSAQMAALFATSSEIAKSVSAYAGWDNLTETQRTALTATSSDIAKWVSSYSGYDTLTDTQKAALFATSSEIAKSVSAYAGWDNLTETQRTALTATNAEISKWVSAYSGYDTLTTAQKAALFATSSEIAKSVSAYAGWDNLTETQRTALTATSSDIAKWVSSYSGYDTLTDTQKAALFATSSEIAKSVSAYAGWDNLTETQRTALTATNAEISKWVSAYSGYDTLTTAQKAALFATSSEIAKSVSAYAGWDNLTETQRTALTATSSDIAKWVSSYSGYDTLTDTQKAALFATSSEIAKSVSAYAGWDNLTETQRTALTATNAEISKWVSAYSGNNTLSPEQQAALFAASETISKTINAIGGYENLTESQKTLLSILGGSSDGQVTVGGAVDYEPSNELDRLMGNLTSALGKVGVDRMTAELGRLVAAIDQQMAADAKSKAIADAQRAGANLKAQQANIIQSVNTGLQSGFDLFNQYGTWFADQAGNQAVMRVNETGLFNSNYYQLGNAVSNDIHPELMQKYYGDYATRWSNGSIFAQTYGQASTLQNLADSLETARQQVRNLGGTPEFATGGYTGSGGVNQPAGIVHKGEIVWSQSDIASAGGVGTVEAMRKGFMPYASDMPAPGVVYNTTQSTISFDESALLEELQALREEVSNLRYEARASTVSNNKTAKYLKEFDERGIKVKNISSDILKVEVV